MHLRTDICCKQLLSQCSLWLSYAGTKIKSKIAFNIFKCYKESNSRKKNQAEVGSSIDLNGDLFSITFHGRNKIV